MAKPTKACHPGDNPNISRGSSFPRGLNVPKLSRPIFSTGPSLSRAERDTTNPPETYRLASSNLAAVFITSPWKTMSRLVSPISPTTTAPKCRLPRTWGACPNSRSKLPEALARASIEHWSRGDTEHAVEHRVASPVAQPLGGPRRSGHVDEKHKALLLPGCVVEPGN
jgi:hypothetical protein